MIETRHFTISCDNIRRHLNKLPQQVLSCSETQRNSTCTQGGQHQLLCLISCTCAGSCMPALPARTFVCMMRSKRLSRVWYVRARALACITSRIIRLLFYTVTIAPDVMSNFMLTLGTHVFQTRLTALDPSLCMRGMTPGQQFGVSGHFTVCCCLCFLLVASASTDMIWGTGSSSYQVEYCLCIV